MAKTKLNDEDRKRIVEERGYRLLKIDREKIKNRMFIFITIECSKGHISRMKWDNFQQGKDCKYCANNVRFTYEEVKTYIENFGYKLLSSEYNSGKEKLLVKCPNPNHEPYEVRFYAFKNQNSRCEKCSRTEVSKKRKHDYDFIKESVDSCGYKLLSEKYEGTKQTLLIECLLGHKYTTTWSKFQQGCRCPYCNESKGEKEVAKILEKYNVLFVLQYKFDDCRNVNPLPFDFYLPKCNCCIEYDGLQHFEIVKHFGGLDGFISRIIRDTIKNEYCKKNNIRLIRIPYWDFNNIEDILKRELEL